jgi:hypothetical protein
MHRDSLVLLLRIAICVQFVVIICSSIAALVAITALFCPWLSDLECKAVRDYVADHQIAYHLMRLFLVLSMVTAAQLAVLEPDLPAAAGAESSGPAERKNTKLT